MRQMLAVSMLVSALAAAAPAGSPWPGDSLYQVRAALEDQSANKVGFDRHAGHPTLVSMFYARCPHVCPMLVASIARLERELDPAARARLRVMMVSVDPDDAPARLSEVVERHRLDTSRWTLARSGPEDIRMIAAALDVRYRRLPDGEYSHSTVLVLLDGQGRPLARTEQVMDPPAEFRAALAAATKHE